MLTVSGSSPPLTINFHQYIHRSSILSISSPQRPLTQRYPKRYKKGWPPIQRKLKGHLKEVDLYYRRQTIIRLRQKSGPIRGEHIFPIKEWLGVRPQDKMRLAYEPTLENLFTFTENIALIDILNN